MSKNLPFKIKLEKGKTYFWCSCGKSSNEPFCSGAHQGTGMFPKSFIADNDGEFWLCGCKKTTKPPFCDGTHQKLKK